MNVRNQIALKRGVIRVTLAELRRHVQHLLDREVRPRRILRQPCAEGVMDIQHARCLKLQYQHGGETLRDAHDPEQRVRTDGFPVLQ